MARWLTLVLLLATAASAAVEDRQVLYVGGTLPGVKEGSVGRLDSTGDASLIFEHADGKVAVPYARITAYEYTHKMAHDLGVIPAVSVVLFKTLRQRHYFRISYRDDAGTPQVMLLEVAKQAPATLLAILQTRAPQACRLPRPCTVSVEKSSTGESKLVR